MKCKYRFRVEGKLKPTFVHPILVWGTVYELETNENGVLTHITATRQIDEQHWPKLTPNPEPGIQLNLHISHKPFAFVQQEMRVIEGLLSYYGLNSIDLKYPQITWIPETEEEQQKLHLFSWHETRKTELDDCQIIPVPFDLIVRAFIGARYGIDVEVPLSFFRKGRIDMDENQYIEAVYDFYFLLETLYADGKTSKKETIKAFQNSEELLHAIEKVLNEPGLYIAGDEQIWEEYRSKYNGKTIHEILEVIFELRGLLHHHTLKRKRKGHDTWHPEQHEKYKTDALFLQAVAYHVALDLSDRCIFNDQVIAEYQRMFQGITTMPQSNDNKVKSTMTNADKAQAEVTLTSDMHQTQEPNNPWQSLLDSLDRFSDDFMETREQPSLQVRENLFE
jgi:hypothetical protein